jgi:hypothetical protein
VCGITANLCTAGACKCGGGNACNSGQQCVGSPGSCACTFTSCGGGCCSGTTCNGGSANNACGTNANSCVDCTTIPSQICLGSRTCGCASGDGPYAGTTCASPWNIGSVGQNSTQSFTGRLRSGDNWFVVNFTTAPAPTGGFHPQLGISGNGYVFEVRVGSCSGGDWACAPGDIGDPSFASSVTAWEVKGVSGRTDGQGCGAPCGSQKCICNSCSCTSGGGYSATPAVGVILIHVFRPAGPSCGDYTLTVID